MFLPRETLGFVGRNLCKALHFLKLGCQIIGSQTPRSEHLCKFQHVNNEHVKWQLRNAVLVGHLACITPVIYGCLHRELAQLATFLRALVDEQDDYRRGAARQCANGGSNQSGCGGINLHGTLSLFIEIAFVLVPRLRLKKNVEADKKDNPNNRNPNENN
jgi:hypothetical protein